MRTRTAPLAFLLTLFLPLLALAAIQSRSLPIVYGKDPAGNDIVGECSLTWDDAIKTPQPAILVFPEWWGLNDYTKNRAVQLANMGYVALAVDIYGNGKTTTDAKEAGDLATPFRTDRKLLRARGIAAMETLRKLREVDPAKISAIGYCFGGTAALELARSGADLKSVISFHGDLSNPTPTDARNIKAQVLVCHGALDPLVPADVVSQFKKEMDSAHIDYVFIAYANAVHAFTNPAAGRDISKGIAYNALADARSWQALRDFFAETLR